MSDRKATLTFSDSGKSIDLDILRNRRSDTVDISSLYSQGKVFTAIPASYHRELLQLNHLYRRQPGRAAVSRVPDRAAGGKSTFIEVAYLLLYGELPSPRNWWTSTMWITITR